MKRKRKKVIETVERRGRYVCRSRRRGTEDGEERGKGERGERRRRRTRDV